MVMSGCLFSLLTGLVVFDWFGLYRTYCYVWLPDGFEENRQIEIVKCFPLPLLYDLP